MEIKSANRGSEWRKWDLHMHTPLSIIQDFGGDSPEVWEKYISAIESLPEEVKVIGINDYYFIDGFEKVISFKKKGRLKNIETFLPVLEFRIDIFSSASENKFAKINLHIVFDINDHNIKSDIEAIKSEFIGNIHLSSSHKTEKLTKENLIKYSAEGKLKSGFSDLIPSTEEVLRCIKSDQWKNKTITLLGYTEWNDLDKSKQLKRNKMNLYNFADAFFTASKDDNIRKKEEVLGFIGKSKPAKPLLHSLDLHKLKNFEKEEYKCFTWIKAEPTFNGLKQIIYEPQSRVAIQNDMPEPKANYSVIDAVRFISKGSRQKDFTNDWIYMNQNLNSIIGGKSSGKSIFLYHIAKTISPERIEEIQKDENYSQLKYSFEEDDNFNFEVKWSDGEIYKLKSRKSRNRSITYLPQLYLNRLAEEQKHELNKLVDNMLREANEKYRNFIREHEEQIEKLQTDILKDIQLFCSNREKLLVKSKELKELGDEKAIQKNIEQVKGVIDNLRKESKFTKAQEERLEKLSGDKQVAETEFSGTDQLIEILEFSKNEIAILEDVIDDTFHEVMEKIDVNYPDAYSINTEIVENIFTAIVNAIKQTVDSEVKKNFSVIGTYKSNRTKQKTKLDRINRSIRPFEEKIKSKESFEKNRKIRNDEEKKLKAIQRKKSEIEKIKRKISSKGFEAKYKNLFTHYRSIVKENKRYQDIKGAKGLKIESRIKYECISFRENFLEKINKRKSPNQIFGNMFNDEGAFLFDEKNHVSNISSILKKINDGKIIFNAGFYEEQVLNALFGNYCSIDYDLIQNGDNLLRMSPGKVGIVLFQIFLHLSKSTNPILIDQPEDSLDNRTVYRELNEFIKGKKTQRQIIIVSHNANLVVSTDSENIIVANQDGQNKSAKNRTFKFEYVNGALEQSFIVEDEKGILFQKGIRQHVCEILEGGDEAFKKREMKYGF